MSPLEVDVLLNYSSMKSSLQSMVADAGKSFKELQASAFDWKNIQDQFDPEQLKTALGLKSLKNKVSLSDIIDATDDAEIKKKLGSDDMLKTLGLKDIKGKISLADLVKSEGAAKIMAGNMGAINWMPLVSKLFAPANLIAMFSAMAAMGITTAISQQNAATSATTSTSTTPSSSGIASTVTGTQQVTDTIGSLAGSSDSVANMIGQLENYGLSASDAVDVTTNLGEALKLTGGQMSDTFNAQFVQYLQSVGATGADAINQVISGLTTASQSAGVLGGGISGIMSSTQDFAVAAQNAGTSVDGIMQSVDRYGVEASSNLQGAQAGLTILTATLQGTNPQLNALMGSATLVAQNLDTNVNGAWDTMNQKIANIDKEINGPLIAAAYGLTAPIIESVGLLNQQKDKIDEATTAAINQASSISNINDEYSKTLTFTDQIDVLWTNINNTLGALTQGAMTDMGALLSGSMKNFDAIKNAVDGITASELWDFIKNPQAAIANGLSSWFSSLLGGSPSGTAASSGSTSALASSSDTSAMVSALQTIAKNTNPANNKPPSVSVSPIISAGGNSSTMLNNAIYGK